MPPMAYTWLSLRGYRFSELRIERSDFEEILKCPGNLSCGAYSSFMNNQREVSLRASALLHLIEISHRLKKIQLHTYTIENGWIRLVFYLAEHAEGLEEILFYGSSAQNVIETLKVFRNLTSVTWFQAEDSVWTKDLSDLMSIPDFPNIKKFDLTYAVSSLEPQVTSAIISACSNLTHLKCIGKWMVDGLKNVLMSCRNLTYLDITNHHSALRVGVFNQLMPLIAEFASSLRSLKVAQFLAERNLSKLDLRSPIILSAMKSILCRLHHLGVGVGVGITAERGDISCMFDPSPSSNIDLKSLRLQTDDCNPDMIVKLLRGCRNAHELDLSGKANVSQVMMEIADSCRKLVTLRLIYEGELDGSALKSLLQSCPNIENLTLGASLDVLAYESLGIYAGSVTFLCLGSSSTQASTQAPSISSDSSSIPSTSPIFDPSFKQIHRRKQMKHLILCESHYVKIENCFDAFVSCFGKIRHVQINPRLFGGRIMKINQWR
jgi:hypothetical protein